MTDINKKFKFLTAQEAKKLCQARNAFTVDLNMQRFIYPGYSAEPSYIDYTTKTMFSEIIEEFAYFYRHGLMYLFKHSYERYICSMLPEDYIQYCFDEGLYEKCFKVVYFNKLSYRLYHKDILFFFEDDYILVCVDPSVASKFRNIRGVK